MTDTSAKIRAKGLDATGVCGKTEADPIHHMPTTAPFRVDVQEPADEEPKAEPLAEWEKDFLDRQADDDRPWPGEPGYDEDGAA